MRFHIGCSFRLKSLTKFLIPIALGVLAYFGFGGLFGCIKVNADENFNTDYFISYNENADFSATFAGSTYQDIFDDLIELNSNYYDIVISYIDYDIKIYLIPKNYGDVNINIYGYDVALYITSPSDFRGYYFSYNSSFNSNDEVYSNFLSCYQDNIDCESSVSNSYGYSFDWGDITFNYYGYLEINNNDSYSFTNVSSFIYYTNANLVYLPDDFNDSYTFVKSVTINSNPITIDDNFLTYYDIFVSDPVNPDNPDDPVNPDDPDVPSDQTIIDYIYWFTGENLTEFDVLVNLYVLLFLYCVTNLVVKFLAFIKGVKW